MTQIVEILSALFLEKGLERYIMIQSKRIAELMDIYKQAEKCYKYNQRSSFYRCLENKLVLAARKYNDEKEILEEYKIACQSYLDSNILKTNISIATLVLSIAGLLKLIDVKVTVEAENSVVIAIIISVVLIVCFGIHIHMKRRKLLEISHVLEKIAIKNVPSNEKNSCDREK